MPAINPYSIGSIARALPLKDLAGWERRDIDNDPRGIPWILEPPRPSATYIMGIDPTVGITGWARELRTQDDSRTDNGAIEIIRVPSTGPDICVFEYAAPVDIYDLARVANVAGRLYGGNNEDGQCLCIPEAYPGPGLPLIQELIHKYGYTNLYIWRYLDTMVPKQTGSLGFYASPKAVQHLWIRAKRRISKGLVTNLSPWLVEEMADCEEDPVKMWGKASSGMHDDRVRALMLAEWAAHDWSLDVETHQTDTIPVEHRPDWQRTDCTLDQLHDQWNERFQELLDD